MILGCLLGMGGGIWAGWGQSRTRGRVVVAIVPMVGSGTAEDPRRPQFAPTPKEMGRAGALDFHFVLSDDKRWAIVAFSAAQVTEETMKALDGVERAAETGGKSFTVGKDRREDVEVEARKVKKDFDLNELLGSVDTKGGRQ